MEEVKFAGIDMIRPDIFEQMKMDALGSISPSVQPQPTGFPMMLASNDIASLAERSQMADIERQTGVNINPYDIPVSSDVRARSDTPRKTISYEEAREIERRMMEERKREARRRQEATVSPRERPMTVPLPSTPSAETLNAEFLFRNRE